MNTVIVIMDSVRLADVDAETMPNLLSNTLNEVVVPSTWTLPVHTSIFTGQDPVTHNVTRPSQSLTSCSFAGQLGEEYTLGGFSENPYFSGRHGFSQCTDYFDDDIHLKPKRSSSSIARTIESQDSLPRRYMAALKKALGSGEPTADLYNGLHLLRSDEDTQFQFYGQRVLEHTSSWLKSTEKNAIAVVNLFDAHQPHIPTSFSSELGYEFTEQQIESFKNFDGMEYVSGKPIEDVDHIHGFSSWKTFFKKLRQAYRTQIRYLDHIVQDFVNNLEDTAVIVTSDHGQMLGEEGWFDHHGVLHPRAIRVPFVTIDVESPEEELLLHNAIKSTLASRYPIDVDLNHSKGLIASDGIARLVTDDWTYTPTQDGIQEDKLLCRRVSYLRSGLETVYESSWNEREIYEVTYNIKKDSRKFKSREQYTGNELSDEIVDWLKKKPGREEVNSEVEDRLEQLGYA